MTGASSDGDGGGDGDAAAGGVEISSAAPEGDGARARRGVAARRRLDPRVPVRKVARPVARTVRADDVCRERERERGARPGRPRPGPRSIGFVARTTTPPSATASAADAPGPRRLPCRAISAGRPWSWPQSPNASARARRPDGGGGGWRRGTPRGGRAGSAASARQRAAARAARNDQALRGEHGNAPQATRSAAAASLGDDEVRLARSRGAGVSAPGIGRPSAAAAAASRRRGGTTARRACARSTSSQLRSKAPEQSVADWRPSVDVPRRLAILPAGGRKQRNYHEIAHDTRVQHVVLRSFRVRSS